MNQLKILTDIFIVTPFKRNDPLSLEAISDVCEKI